MPNVKYKVTCAECGLLLYGRFLTRRQVGLSVSNHVRDEPYHTLVVTPERWT